MTPEQEDTIIRALRPLCPGQDPEQLRSIVRQVIGQINSGDQAAAVEQELLRRFPALKNLLHPRQ